MIRSELGSSPFLPPFPRLILPPPRATRRSAAPAPTNRSLQPLPTDPAAAHPRSPPPARPSPIPYQFQTAPVDPPTLEPATQLATTISVLPPRRRSSRPSFPSDSNQNRKPTTPWLLPFLFPSSLSALSLSLSPRCCFRVPISLACPLNNPKEIASVRLSPLPSLRVPRTNSYITLCHTGPTRVPTGAERTSSGARGAASWRGACTQGEYERIDPFPKLPSQPNSAAAAAERRGFSCVACLICLFIHIHDPSVDIRYEITRRPRLGCRACLASIRACDRGETRLGAPCRASIGKRARAKGNG
jgi:hypothetical protein